MEKQLSLQIAYLIAWDKMPQSADRLFWAIDRFYHDRSEADDHAKAQRSEATQRCAIELDRRGIPMRDPNGPKAYPGIVPN